MDMPTQVLSTGDDLYPNPFENLQPEPTLWHRTLSVMKVTIILPLALV
ncbi:hypothetical protein KIPB_009610, partial [Kipferlia bialata]|eukprot:g9610.t1